MGNGKISKNGRELINNLVLLADKSGNGNGKIDTQAEQQKLSEQLMSAISSGTLKSKDLDKYKAQVNCPLNHVFTTNSIEPELTKGDTVHLSSTKNIPVEQPVADTRTQNDIKLDEKAVTNYIHESAKNKAMTLEEMMTYWEKYSTQLKMSAKEKKEIQAIVDIINAQPPETKEDVNNLEKVVKNALGDKMTELQKDVLSDIVKLAERDVMVKKAGTPTEKYNELRQAVKEGEQVNYQKLYDDALAQSGYNKKDDYSKEAAAILKNYIKKEAYVTYRSALDTIYKKGIEKNSAMDTKAVIAELENRFKDDAIMLEVIKENKKVYRNNKKEGPADAVARSLKLYFRKKELSNITENDLAELQKKNPDLERKLWKYLEENGKNDKGEYSMDSLYEKFETRHGADNFVNKSRNPQLSEFGNVMKDMQNTLHLDKKELKQLLDFMHIDYAKRTHYLNDAVGVAGKGAAAAAGVVPAIHKDVFNATVDMTTIIHLTNMSEETVNNGIQELAQQIGENATISTTGTGIEQQVNISIKRSSDNILHGVTGAAAGVLAAILVNWAIGQAPDELACTNITEDAYNIKNECGNDLDKLKEYLEKHHTPNATRSLNMLLNVYAYRQKSEYEAKNKGKQFDAKTMFDTAGFIDFISKIGGSGSVTNCQELTMATITTHPAPKSEEPVHTLVVGGQEEEGHYEDQTVKIETVKFKTWVGHTYEYSCLRKLFDNTPIKLNGILQDTDRKAARALKIIQAIKPEKLKNYINNETKLVELVKKSFEEPDKMKSEEDLDYKKYDNVLSSGSPEYLNLPETLLGCKRKSKDHQNQKIKTGGKGSFITQKEYTDHNYVVDKKSSGYYIVDGERYECESYEEALKNVQEIKKDNKTYSDVEIIDEKEKAENKNK